MDRLCLSGRLHGAALIATVLLSAGATPAIAQSTPKVRSHVKLVPLQTAQTAKPANALTLRALNPQPLPPEPPPEKIVGRVSNLNLRALNPQPLPPDPPPDRIRNMNLRALNPQPLPPGPPPPPDRILIRRVFQR